MSKGIKIYAADFQSLEIYLPSCEICHYPKEDSSNLRNCSDTHRDEC